MKDFIKKRINEALITEDRLNFDLPIPEDILNIKDVFKQNGHKLYVVGGAVRDALLGKTPKDYDLATDAVPDKVEEMMRRAGLRTIPTGKAFGVINVFTDKDEYEVATFRKDLSGGRRPDAVEFTNIEGDVTRRDLTINALFYDIDTHEIVDLVGGIEDIKNGVVRTVGQASDRFGEDRLRILRAIRFAGRFGSELDPAIHDSLLSDNSLEGVSPERIRDEFLKGLKSAKSVKHFLGLNKKYGLLNQIFNGFQDIQTDFIDERDPIINIGWILRNNDSNVVAKTLNKLKYSSDEAKAIKFLIDLKKLSVDNVVDFKRAQTNSKTTPEQINRFGKMIGLNDRLINAFINFKLSVSGDEVMAKFNMEKGIELGNKIKSIETDNFKKML